MCVIDIFKDKHINNSLKWINIGKIFTGEKKRNDWDKNRADNDQIKKLQKYDIYDACIIHLDRNSAE